MGEQGVNFISNILVIILIFIGLILISYSINLSYLYLIGFVPLVLILILSMNIRKKAILDGLNKKFKKEWGKNVERKRNFKNIRLTFDYIEDESNDEFCIDDQTWSDLTMDEMYTIMDRTITSPGEEMLYKTLRMPLFSEEKLKNRNAIINLFQNNEEFRNNLGKHLLKLNRVRKNHVPDLLWSDIEVDMKYKSICRILAILPILLALALFFTKQYILLFPLIIVFCVNPLLHTKIKKTIYQYVSCIGYANALITAASSISKLNGEELKEYKDVLSDLSKKVNPILKKTGGIGRVEGVDQTGISDILYMIFLLEENQFFSCIDLIKKHQQDLKKLYMCVGEIDALLSIASYREGLENFTTPEFTQENGHFEAKDMVHPLVSDAVSNDITMTNKGIILTGSNMSGKSTFLRTIGVNCILAQTIYMTTSSFYRASFFKIMTSISPEDNIMSGKSYYFREAEALLRIIEEGGEDYPLLCIIDEIFRGTNPVERINASIEILGYLERHNSLAVVATHDLELTDRLKNSYDMFYFTEDMERDGLVFDYKLKDGVCRTRNAVKLLKYLKYPEEIIENTNRRIEESLKTSQS